MLNCYYSISCDRADLDQDVRNGLYLLRMECDWYAQYCVYLLNCSDALCSKIRPKSLCKGNKSYGWGNDIAEDNEPCLDIWFIQIIYFNA